jgi:small nuclear ribonucleoprotein (snRNP)-like protein
MEGEKYSSYDEFLREKLSQHVLLRHLFARLGKEVEVATSTGEHIRGELRTIDLSYRFFEVIDHSINKAFFIKFDFVVYLKSEQVV